MNHTEKEKRFVILSETGLCAVLVILYAVGIIPLALCVVLGGLSFVAMAVIYRSEEE
jgi:hypothetical protein